MDGEVKITDKQGSIILASNIWTMVLMCAFSGRFSIPVEDINVFIDDNEIRLPEWYEKGRERG